VNPNIDNNTLRERLNLSISLLKERVSALLLLYDQPDLHKGIIRTLDSVVFRGTNNFYSKCV